MKFAEMREFANVYQVFDIKNPIIEGPFGEVVDMKGNWAAKHFKNKRPICLELACGRGEYSLGLSALYPDINFIGVDIKGARIWKGARTAISKKQDNIAFLRTRIEILDLFFAENEVSEIWITFPDPFIHKINRRLTCPMFLDRYKKLLAKDHKIHLKTDSQDLYEYTKEVLEADKSIKLIEDIPDIYALDSVPDVLNIKTYYENMHLENKKKITYLCFQLDF